MSWSINILFILTVSQKKYFSFTFLIPNDLIVLMKDRFNNLCHYHSPIMIIMMQDPILTYQYVKLNIFLSHCCASDSSVLE